MCDFRKICFVIDHERRLVARFPFLQNNVLTMDPTSGAGYAYPSEAP